MYLGHNYVKGDFVFAQSFGYKPYPAKITSINPKNGSYNVKFINYKSSAKVVIDMLEPFNEYTIQKYLKMYKNSLDKEERSICRKIKLAKLEFEKSRKPRNKSKLSKKGLQIVVHQVRQQPLDQSLHSFIELAEQKPIEKERDQQVVENQKDQKEVAEQNLSQKHEQRQDEKEIEDLQKEVECFNDCLEESSSSYINLKSQISDHQNRTIVPCKNPFQLLYRTSQFQEARDTIEELSPFLSNHQNSSLQDSPQLPELNPTIKLQHEIKSSVGPMQIQNYQSKKTSNYDPFNEQSMIFAQSNSEISSFHFSHFQKPKQQAQPPCHSLFAEDYAVKQEEIERNSPDNNLSLPSLTNQCVKHQFSLDSDSSEQHSILGKNFNNCSDIDFSDPDDSYDEMSIEEGDHHMMLKTMDYRVIKLSHSTARDHINRINRYIKILRQHLTGNRKRSKYRCLLSIKKRQYLIAILSFSSVKFKDYLMEYAIFKMVDFIYAYDRASPEIKRFCMTEYFYIRAKLNILWAYFDAHEDELMLTLTQSSLQDLHATLNLYERHKVMVR